MDRGSKVIELRQNRGEDTPAGALPQPDGLADQASQAFDAEAFQDWDEAPATGRWRRPLALLLCVGGALAWLGLLGSQTWTALAGRAPNLSDLATFITAAAPPLALFGVLWLVLMRSSRAEAEGFAKTRQAMEDEGQRLEALLAFVSTRIESARQGLASQSESLLTLGDETATKMNAAVTALGKEIAEVGTQADTLKGTSGAARDDLAQLMAALPKAENQLRNVAATLETAGATVHTGAKALSAEVLALGLRSQEAKGLAADAAAGLSAQFAAMNDTAAQIHSLVRDSEAALATSGDTASVQLGERIRAIGAEIDRIGDALARHDQSGNALIQHLAQGVGEVEQHFLTMEQDVTERAARIGRALADRVGEGIGAVDSRMTALEAKSNERADRLGLALGALRNHADDLRTALEGGHEAAGTLSEKTESLLTALDAAAREMDETIPAAYARLEVQAGKAMATANAVAPLMASLAATSETVADRVSASDRILASQKTALDRMAAAAEEQLTNCQEQAEALVALIGQANDEAGSFSRTAGTDLLDILARTREVSRQVTQQSREALAAIIPQSALDLGQQSREALSVALGEEVETQMAGLSEAIERSVAAAKASMAELEGQLRQMGQASAALEARIDAAQDESDRRDHTHFARRVALLIESLNSTAIDVTKILSNEVTDAAWASYMRGDRGVFARRAVKLLDNSEAREIARHYQDDPEFREQVNRYIHDYEAMLRNVMATREGTPLSVALLSADTGKLYVALAQAIERLRS
jgi:hypothetical protein